MADAVGAPQAPRKALFKPSTKTPPVRKFKSRSVKPAGTEAPSTPNRFPSKAGTATPGTEAPKAFRTVSKTSELPRTSSKAGGEESAKPPPETSTRPSKAESESGKLGQDYAASDTTGDTATGTVNDEVFTPDTVRSNDAPHTLSRKSSEAVTADRIHPNSQGSGETETQEEHKGTPVEASEQRLRPKPASVVSESKEDLDDEAAAPAAATRRHRRPRPVTVTTGSKDQSPQPLSDDDSAVSMGGSPLTERDDESLQGDGDSDVFRTPGVAAEDGPDEKMLASHVPEHGAEDTASELADAVGDSSNVKDGSPQSLDTANDANDVANTQTSGDTAQAPGDVPDQGADEELRVPTNEAVKKPTADTASETDGDNGKTVADEAVGATEAIPDDQEAAAAEATAEGPGDTTHSGVKKFDQTGDATAERTGHAASSASGVIGEVGATAAEAREGTPEAGEVDVADGADVTAGAKPAGDAQAIVDATGAPAAEANAGADSVAPAEDTGKVPGDVTDKIAGETDTWLGGAAGSLEDATKVEDQTIKADADAGVENASQAAQTAGDEADSAREPIAETKQAIEGGDAKAADATADDSAAGTADAPESEGAEAVDGSLDVPADETADAPGQDGAIAPEAEAHHVGTEDAMDEAAVDAVAGAEDVDADNATGAPEADVNDAAQVSAPDEGPTDAARAAAPDADNAAETHAAGECEEAETTGKIDVDSGVPAAGADATTEAPISEQTVEASAPVTEHEAAGAAEDSSVDLLAPEAGIDTATDSATDISGTDADRMAKAPETDAGMEGKASEADTEANVAASDADPVAAGAPGANTDATDESPVPVGETARRTEDAAVKPKSSEAEADVAPEATEAEATSEAPGVVTDAGVEPSATASGAEAAEENTATESGNAAIASAAASEAEADIANEAPAPVLGDITETDVTETSANVATHVGADTTDTGTDTNGGLAADATKSVPNNNADQATGEVQSEAQAVNSAADGDAANQEPDADVYVDPASIEDAPETSNGLAADAHKDPESSTDVASEGAPSGTVTKVPEAGGEAPEAVSNATDDVAEDDASTAGGADSGAATGVDVSTAQGEATETLSADIGAAPDSGVAVSKATDDTDAPCPNEETAGEVAQDVSAEAPTAGGIDADVSVGTSGADKNGDADGGNVAADDSAEPPNTDSGAAPDVSDAASAPEISADQPGKLARSASGSIIRPNYVRDQVAHFESGPRPGASRATSSVSNDEAALGVAPAAPEAGAAPAEDSASVPEGATADAGAIGDGSADSQADAAGGTTADEVDDKSSEPVAFVVAPSGTITVDSTIEEALHKAEDAATDAEARVDADAAGDTTVEKANDGPSEPVAFVVAPSGTITVDSTIEEALHKAEDIAADAETGVDADAGDGVADASEKTGVAADQSGSTVDDVVEGAIEKTNDTAVEVGDGKGGSADVAGGADNETVKEGVDKAMGTADASGQQLDDASEVSRGATGPVDDATAGPQQQGLDDSAGDLPDPVAKVEAGLMQPTELIRYFLEHGNPEMAEFIKALMFVEAPHDAESTMAAAKDAAAAAATRGQDSASAAAAEVSLPASGTNEDASAVQNGAHEAVPQSPAAQKRADGAASDLDADPEHVAGHASGALPDGAELPQGAPERDATVKADGAVDSATSLAGGPTKETGNISADAGTTVPGDAVAGDAAAGDVAAGDVSASDADAKINANDGADAAAGDVGNDAAEANADAPGYFDAATKAANESTPIPAVADIFGMPGAVTLAPGGTTLPGASAVAPGSIAVPGAKEAGVTPRSAGADLLVDPPVPPADEEPAVVAPVTIDEPAADEPAEIVGITDVTELPPAEQGPDFEDIAAPHIEEPLPPPEIEVVAQPGDPIQAREIVDGVTLAPMTAAPQPQPDLPDAADVAEPLPFIPDPPKPEEVANNLHLPDHAKAAVEGAQEGLARTATDTAQESSSTPAAGGPGQGGRSRFVGLGPAAGGDAPAAGGGAQGSGGVPANGAGFSSEPPVVDNMGKPAYVNRQINIPIPRPDGATSSRASPNMKPKSNVPGVDDLNDVNGLDDPPEEFLDPNIHSPKVEEQETVIPSIPKIPPITSKPPENLKQLAIGLAGHVVDDVGNIVDGEGKVLGHATGDLPSMIGKMVTEGGEIYGDRGELVGYVSLNFVNPPPTEEAAPEESNTMPFPANLRIDRQGNILDGSGNIIGKLNEAPLHASTRISAPPTPQSTAEQGQLTPTERTSRTQAPPKAEAGQEQPSTSKPASGDSGIPSDIFLDVKSTPDGIQLMIRIPTIFKQESR